MVDCLKSQSTKLRPCREVAFEFVGLFWVECQTQALLWTSGIKHRGLKLWISVDFSSRVTHYDCKNRRTLRILRYGKINFNHNKKCKGRTQKFTKTVKMPFSAVAWTCAPYLWCHILTALDDLPLYMSHNFPCLLRWKNFSIFLE